MKTTIKLLATLAFVLAIFSPQTAANAGGGPGFYNFKARGGHAHFSNTDPSGCIVTDVFVFAAEEVLKTPHGPADASPRSTLQISQYDTCTDTLLLAADGSTALAGSDLQVANKLKSATLDTTINVFDQVSNTSFDVTVNLNWAGTGDLIRDNQNFQIRSPGCIVNLRMHGTFRSAEASGSISDGTTEFAPGSSVEAGMFSVKNGSVTVGCDA